MPKQGFPSAAATSSPHQNHHSIFDFSRRVAAFSLSPLHLETEVRHRLPRPIVDSKSAVKRRLQFASLICIAGLLISPAPAATSPSADRLQELEELRYADPDAAMQAALAARDSAATPEEALAFTALIAGFHRIRADYDQAEALATDGLARARELKNDDLAAQFLYRLARIRWSRGDYPGSIALFHEAIPLAEASRNLALLCDIHTGITTDYALMKDWDKVDHHLAQARRYAELINDQRRLGDYFKVLGNSYTDRNNPAAAQAAHEQSRAFHAAVGNDRGVGDALQNLGHIHEARGDFATAEKSYREAIAIYERLNLPRHLSTASRRLGRMLARRGDFAAAVGQLERSLTLSEQFSAPANIADAHQELARAYESAGDFAQALDHQRRYWTIANQLTGEKAQRDVAVLDARFESERARHEADLLRAEQALQEARLARVSSQRWSLLGLVLAGSVAVAAIIARQRLKLATERRIRAESETARRLAEEADNLKTHLLGIASHDLKSPLGTILASARLLREKHPPDSLPARLAAQIDAQGERMFRLIRDLLDHAALETGQLKLAPTSIDLAALACDVARDHHAAAQAKSIAIEVDAPVPAPGEADPHRLRQAIDNLVGNAIKFSPAHTRVTVAVEPDDRALRLSVRDQGPGLAPGDFARLFQPFQQLSARPTGGEPGSGLGLWIAREIIALHRGRLDVDSVPGGGTTFTLEIPRLAAPTSA